METQIKIGIEKLQFSISKYGNLRCDKQSPVYDKEAKGPVMNFFLCDFILFVCLFLLYFCIESALQRKPTCKSGLHKLRVLLSK